MDLSGHIVSELDQNNCREVQAREVIDAWVSKGYSLRQIITDALIGYGNNKNQSVEIDTLLKQLRELINQGANRQLQESSEGNDHTLPGSFLGGIRKSMKEGLEVKNDFNTTHDL